MLPLNLLWVNGGVTGLREAWMSEFSSLCRLHETAIADLAAQDASGNWDAVFFNFDYPEVAALRLIPETKRRWPSAPIVMLTMQGSPELVLWALRVRVFDVLVKPITRQEIERCMQRITEAIRARRSQAERRPQTGLMQIPVVARYRPQLSAATRLQMALAHIGKNYIRHIPESEVALVCEMSPSRFCREFKAAFGMTFLDYLTKHRVSEAKRLLANPRISIMDVAAAVGFSDPSYFTRVFRKHEGVSPTTYRDFSGTRQAV